MEKINISSLNILELENFILEQNEKKFRGKQIYKWLHKDLVNNFDDMTNISKDFREKLKSVSEITKIEILEKIESKKDNTVKYLFKLHDNNIIEGVLMKHSFGNSICVSTQVGCRMGCSFCASTLNGLERNLNTGEILNQIYEVQKDLGERISNVVLMGSGEPLDNYDNVIKFIKIINSLEGLNIGERHITLSTCGIVDNIYRLADEKLQITLAISLHSPENNIRRKLMPIGKAISVDELLKACKYYSDKTGRRITYEYALIKDLNDSEETAHILGKLLRRTLAHVNLIPINEVKEKDYKKTNINEVENFASILEGYGVNTTIRRELGSDINASCGQLRNKYLEE